MLQVKSVIILKANPAIFKCSGGIKMGAWHCVEREFCRIRNECWSEEE